MHFSHFLSLPVFLSLEEPLPFVFPWSLIPLDPKWPRHISTTAILSSSLSTHFKLWEHQEEKKAKKKHPISALYTFLQLASISGRLARQKLLLPDLLCTTRRLRDECAVVDKWLVWDQGGHTAAPNSAFRCRFLTAAGADSAQTERPGKISGWLRKQVSGTRYHIRGRKTWRETDGTGWSTWKKIAVERDWKGREEMSTIEQ